MVRGFVLVALLSALLLPACGPIALYTNVKANNYAQPGAVTTAGGNVMTGQSCWQSYFGIVAIGDSSVAEALKAAGVDSTKPVKNLIVDYSMWGIVPFYVEYCTIVNVTVD